jgi:hypothetical protein
MAQPHRDPYRDSVLTDAALGSNQLPVTGPIATRTLADGDFILPLPTGIMSQSDANRERRRPPRLFLPPALEPVGYHAKN